MTGKIVALLLAAALVVGGVLLFIRQAQAPAPVGCTMEAMQCPDGSYVGRTGPNCEFVCPTATTTGDTNGIAPYNSGITGTIATGPTCPVEHTPPNPSCANKPYSTVVAVFRAGNPVTPFALAQSDATGAFKLSLPPGSYVVGAGDSSLPRCPQTPAIVNATGYTNLTIVCDTGIR